MVDKISVITTLICLASITTAQTVTLGTFGYSRKDVPIGFEMSAMQFFSGTNSSVSSVYSNSLPIGTKVWSFNGNTYDTPSTLVSYTDRSGQSITNWTVDLDLEDLGSGHWLELPTASEVMYSGNVPMDDVITNSITTGFQICAYPYPVDRVVSNLGISGTIGDRIWVLKGSGYESSTLVFYTDRSGQPITNWTAATLEIGVGDSFWYEAIGDSQWIVERPY